MALIDLNTKPSARDLRWFGALMAGFFALAGLLARWKLDSQPVAEAIWVTGIVIVALYTGIPSLRRWIYLGWLYAALPIGTVVSYLLVAGAYFLVLTPIGLVMRVFRRDPLERSLDRSAETYWIKRPKSSEPERYLKQY